MEKYLENFVVDPNDSDHKIKSKVLLKHSKLAANMGFAHGTRNLVGQITDPFYEIQTMKEFDVLQRRTQVLVASKRLRVLLDFVRNLDSFLEEWEFGVPFILEKHLSNKK